MSVKIFVTDRYSRPLARAKVFVWWEGSTSNAETDSSGIADLRCSGGVIKSIKVNGYEVASGARRVGNDDTVPVQLNR